MKFSINDSARPKIEKNFSLDLRSMALFRILLASTLIIDLLLRSRDLTAHYTDQGVFPKELLYKDLYHWSFSIHGLNGDFHFQLFLFLLSGLFAMSLLVGYRTKVSLIISWILLISLQHRNPTIIFGADEILAVILFWSLFMPLGARFSIDSLKNTYSNGNSLLTTATFIYIMQVIYIYFFNFLAKDGTVWRVDGTAVYYALNSASYSTQFGKFLLSFPEITKFLSFLTLYSEAIIPLLLLIPYKNWIFRMMFIIWMTSLHIGFGLGLNLGIFTVTSITMLAILLPTEFWNYLAKENRPTQFHSALQKSIRTLTKVKSIMTGLVNPQTAKKIPSGFRLSKLTSVFLICCLLYITLWNLSNLDSFSFLMPKQLKSIGHLARLDQRWGFFAPPPEMFSWYQISGQLKNGEQVDLLKDDQPLSFDPPVLGKSIYSNNRWGVYFAHITRSPDKDELNSLADYYCRTFTATNSNNLQQVAVDILYMKILTDYHGYGPMQQKHYITKQCNDSLLP